MKKEEVIAERERAALGEDIYSQSEESFNKDFEQYGEREQNITDIPPGDFYQYKHMVLVPNSQTRFSHLSDKDTVLANYKEKLPDPEYHTLLVETCRAIRDIFCVEKEVPVLDERGKPIPIIREDPKSGRHVIVGYYANLVRVFDDKFIPVVNFLEVGHKFAEVSSRAMGEQRASILDRTQGLRKELSKPQDKSKGAY